MARFKRTLRFGRLALTTSRLWSRANLHDSVNVLLARSLINLNLSFPKLSPYAGKRERIGIDQRESRRVGVPSHIDAYGYYLGGVGVALKLCPAQRMSLTSRESNLSCLLCHILLELILK